MSTISAGVTVPTALNLSGDTTGALTFQVSGTITAATITSAGNVGIGTASPGEKLTVSSASQTKLSVIDTNGGAKMIMQAQLGQLGVIGSENNIPVAFYTNGSERMRLDTSGNLGIGGTADAYAKVHVLGTLPTSLQTSIGFRQTGTVPSGTTSAAYGYNNNLFTQAASFTLSNYYHFFAYQNTIGAGSSITNQYGYFADATLTGATNNYGFYSNIASGTNRWNFYAGGTAVNYFAGDTGIGRAPIAGVRLIARGADTGSANYALICYDSADQILLYARNDGYINTGTRTNSPYNLTTGSAANMFVDSAGGLLRSTSSLRYKSDVADATHGLADVLKLRSVTYKGINDGDKVFGGLIAEEVHDAGLTEFVAYDNEGRPDALHYGNMVALLVKAVQEQQEQIKTLQDRIAELETK